MNTSLNLIKLDHFGHNRHGEYNNSRNYKSIKSHEIFLETILDDMSIPYQQGI
jgi:hypothetical protein